MLHSNGQSVYSFEPTEEYTSLVKKWETTQKTCDINLVVEFLQKNYFFPDAIMAMAEYFKLKGDFSNLLPLIERGIYIFEYCWCPGYNPLASPPNTYIDFSLPLNFLYGKFIFNYIDMLAHQGCTKTALEFSKYLLSCDPYTDPFGVLLFIGYLANRAKITDLMPLLVMGFQKIYNTDVLNIPSIIYSLALSKRTESILPDNVKLQEKVALVLSVKNIKELIFLDEHCLLISALSLFPGIIEVIVKKKGEKSKIDSLPFFTGYQQKGWSEILKHEIFKIELKCEWFDQIAYQKMSAIFDEKEAQCFESSLQWIKSTIGFLLNEPGVIGGIRETLVKMMSHAMKHKMYSHINVTDYMEDLKTLSAEQINERMEQNTFHRFPQPHAVDNNVNPLLLFLQTLLPWNNAH